MDVSAHSMGEPNAGAVLRVAVAITTFGPGVDAPGEVDDEVTLTLRPQPPMSLQDRVGVFEMLIDDAVGHGFPAKCAKISRDIVCRMQHQVFRLTIRHDPPARVEHMIVWLQRSARVVRGNLLSDRTRLPCNAAVLPKPPISDDDDRRRTWPEKGWRRRRTPGNRCRAHSFTQMGVHRTSSRRCG